MKVNRKRPKGEDGTETRSSRGFQCRLVNLCFAQSQSDFRTVKPEVAGSSPVGPATDSVSFQFLG